MTIKTGNRVIAAKAPNGLWLLSPEGSKEVIKTKFVATCPKYTGSFGVKTKNTVYLLVPTERQDTFEIKLVQAFMG